MAVALGCAGCTTVVAGVDAQPTVTPSTPVEDRGDYSATSDALACSAAQSPLSVVQNAAALAGAEISMDAASGMLRSSERQLRDAANVAGPALVPLIVSVAEATTALALADESERVNAFATVSATQADLIAACDTVGVAIRLDAWVGG